MGLFSRSPKPDELDAPLIRGDGETNFLVRGGAGWAFRKALAVLGEKPPKVGGQSQRHDVVLRRQRLGTVVVTCSGYPLGQVADDDMTLVLRAFEVAGANPIRARAYTWRGQDGSLGLRVYLPKRPVA